MIIDVSNVSTSFKNHWLPLNLLLLETNFAKMSNSQPSSRKYGKSEREIWWNYKLSLSFSVLLFSSTVSLCQRIFSLYEFWYCTFLIVDFLCNWPHSNWVSCRVAQRKIPTSWEHTVSIVRLDRKFDETYRVLFSWPKMANGIYTVQRMIGSDRAFAWFRWHKSRVHIRIDQHVTNDCLSRVYFRMWEEWNEPWC